jgi:hypothetical protein
MTGPPPGMGGQSPVDLRGLPPEVLYALIEMLAGGVAATPGQQYEEQPVDPYGMEGIHRWLETLPPPRRMQVHPMQYHELVDYGQYNPWGNVEPGR